MRRDNLASLLLDFLYRLFPLVVDNSLFLEILDLRVISSDRSITQSLSTALPCLGTHRTIKVSTYPAVCAVLLKLLIEFLAETCGLVSPLLCIDTVKYVVFVEALEEGIARGVALLSI